MTDPKPLTPLRTTEVDPEPEDAVDKPTGPIPGAFTANGQPFEDGSTSVRFTGIDKEGREILTKALSGNKRDQDKPEYA